jgi:hypothetical protein
MSLGYDREANIFNLGDTAEVRAWLYDRYDAPVTTDDVLSVSFTIQKPDKTMVTVVGEVEDDGTGLCRYEDTDQAGQYLAMATFTLHDGRRSSRADFEVIDPFEEVTPTASWYVADGAWAKLEDCFDGSDEGPWLREETLNFFTKQKMEQFIDEALFDINHQHPPTALTISYFVTIQAGGAVATADFPLLTQAVFLAVVRHLIRSYVEQPNPVGSQIAWHDRRDYLQRWQSVYQSEQQQYMRMVALFKRRFLGLGKSALLLSSKAGRMIPAPMRTRNVGRGYW